jgi:formylglycine-generating enzyme required for sulfatase activity/uncharacterized caspase-like protein
MSRNWAICIGINCYRNLQRLNYAKQDADAMRQLFMQELGFEQVYHFTDDSPPIPQDYGPDLDSQPTYTTLRRFLRTRFEQPFLRDGDNLWFFFAGHGIRDQNRDYLMPMDGDRSDLENSAISIHYISERLRQSGADNIILLIDACRSFEGRRDGLGIGQEEQQGVITLFSCSPDQAAYEIEELQQGAFTYALLDGLRRQGEGNCATVERLYQKLYYYVPQVTRRYKGVAQIPYGVIEPPTKNHLILLPRQATLADIVTLKNEALTAEVQGDTRRAKQYWVRVLAASPADPEAIDGIERLSSPRTTSVASPNELIRPASSQSRLRSAIPTTSQPHPPISLSPSSSNSNSLPTHGSPVPRRRVIQTLGFTGGLIGAAWLGKTLLQLFLDPQISEPPEDPSSPAPTPPPQPIDPKPEPSLSPSLTAEDFTPYAFEVVTVNEFGEIINREPKQAYAFRETIGESFIDLVAIVGGTFTMGSPADEEGREAGEGPQRDVTVPQFLMGKYPVTQAQWKAVAALPKIERDLEADPAYFEGDNRPVERVSWDAAVEFCQRLSNHTGREYRLPSEAEWEYACRAGTTTPFHFGLTITTNLANYRGTYWEYKDESKTYPGSYGQGPKGEFRPRTTDVGSFPPNAFGLYDMHGNVWEWCLDHWHDTYNGAPTDGSAWLSSGESNLRRTRGGSWYYAPSYCRSAYRGKSPHDLRAEDFGFRIVCASSWAV